MIVAQKAANERLCLGIFGNIQWYSGLEIVTTTAAKAKALKNGDIMSHTMYPERNNRAKKNAYSTTRLIDIRTIIHKINKKTERVAQLSVFIDFLIQFVTLAPQPRLS